MFSVATGLIYGRFSRPQPRILFSENMVIAPYQEGLNAVMFRVSNGRKNVLMDLEASLVLAVQTKNETGFIYKYHRLNLEIDNIHFLPLSWTIVHPIDEGSPLFGKSEAELKAMQGEFMVLFRAFDDGFGQQLLRRSSYTFAKDMIVGARFIRNFDVDEAGELNLNLHQLHEVESCPLNI